MRVVPIIMSVVLSLSLLGGCSLIGGKGEEGGKGDKSAAKNDGKGKKGKKGPPKVSVIAVKKGKYSYTIDVPASLLPDKTVTVLPEVGGVVEKVSVEEGDFVTAGDELYTIEDKDLAVMAKQAKTQVAAAQVAYKLAKVQRDNAKKQFERYQGLMKKKAVTEVQFDEIATAYEASKVQLEQASVAIKIAKVGLENADNTLLKTVVDAPISGFVTSMPVEKGAMVSAASSQTGVVIVSVDPILVEAAVAEMELDQVPVGTEVTITIDSLTDQTFEGAVSMVSPMVDTATRTVTVQVKLPNIPLSPEGHAMRLKPGMAATLSLETQPRSLFKLPLVALKEEEGTKGTVWVIDDKGAMAFRDITIVLREGVYFYAAAGLTEGDRVLYAAPSDLKPGTVVKILKVVDGLTGEEVPNAAP